MDNQTIDNAGSSFDEASVNGLLRKLQRVRAGSTEFGIFADEIATIVGWQEPTELPHAPKSVLGVASIQGRMWTVLELSSLAGPEGSVSDATHDGQRHIVALRGDEQLALAVDSVGETVLIANDELKLQSEPAGSVVLGLLQFDDKEIKILNLKELFAAAIQGRERRRRRF